MLFFLALLGAAPSTAQPPLRIALLPMTLGEPPILRSAEIEAEIAHACEWRPDLALTDSDQLLAQAGDDLLARLRACGGDRACMAAELRGLPVDRVLLLIINDRVRPPLLSVRCLDRDARECGDEASELSASQMTPSLVLFRVLDRLLDGLGSKKRARLEVTTTPSDAAVDLQETDQALAGAPNLFWLLPGRYTATARREGWVETSSVVLIEHAGPVKVDLRLLALPERDGPPWLWIALGIAAAAAGAALAIILTQHHDHCLCLGPKGSCPDCS